MRGIWFAFVVSVFVGASSAQAQTPLATRVPPALMECPASQIQPQFASFRRWNKDHAGVRPVMPELRTAADPEAYIRRVLADPAKDTTPPSAELTIARTRTMLLFVQQGFSKVGEMLDNLNLMPPDGFLEQLRMVKLTRRVVACGRTIVYFPSQAEPDVVIRGSKPMPFAGMWSNEPVLLDFCEVGAVTETGECGVEVIETEEIEITEGPNKGQRQTGRFYIICGNLDFALRVLDEGFPQKVTVDAPLPPPPPPPIKITTTLLPPPVRVFPPVTLVNEPPKPRMRICPGYWKIACLAPLGLLALAIPSGDEAPPVPPSKGGTSPTTGQPTSPGPGPRPGSTTSLAFKVKF